MNHIHGIFSLHKQIVERSGYHITLCLVVHDVIFVNY
jgi:hypothetical protein